MWFKSAAGNRNGANGKRAVPSIVAAGLQIEGDVASDGELNIFGSVRGNVSAQTVTLGEGGVLGGSTQSEVAVIHGTLTGRLAAANVLLGPTAHVTADIIYVSMQIATGAVFEGHSRKVHSLDAASTVKLPSPPPAEIAHARRGETGRAVLGAAPPAAVDAEVVGDAPGAKP